MFKRSSYLVHAAASARLNNVRRSMWHIYYELGYTWDRVDVVVQESDIISVEASTFVVDQSFIACTDVCFLFLKQNTQVRKFNPSEVGKRGKNRECNKGTTCAE